MANYKNKKHTYTKKRMDAYKKALSKSKKKKTYK